MITHNLILAAITAAMIHPGTQAATAANGHAITEIGPDGCRGGMLIRQEATQVEMEWALRWMLKRGAFCDYIDNRISVGPYFSGKSGGKK